MATKAAGTMKQDEELNKLVEQQQAIMNERAASDAKYKERLIEARRNVDRYMAKARLATAMEGIPADEQKAILADLNKEAKNG
jgi:hypothetical protein